MSSDAPLDTVALWLEDCCTKHPMCQLKANGVDDSDDSTSLPTRVLDLRRRGEPDIIRLLETKGRPGRYATLSHRWGSHPVIKTEMASLERHKAGIDVHDLPRTFGDAVGICRQLNIDFLWIDSLCIVQDDMKDWEREAAVMGVVYLKSCLTIAASSSIDSLGGCFMKREIQIHRVGIPCQPVVGYRCGMMTVSSRGGRFEELVDQAPLNERGWGYQERMLSRRTLHCTKGHWFWECRKCGRAEDGQTFDIKPETGSTDPFNPTRWERDLWWTQPSETWYSLLEDYVLLDLTKPTDRLPAVLGLANVVESQCNIPYYRGVWKDSLHVGLLWEPKERAPPATPLQYDAPSWSWAALGAPITFPERVKTAAPAISGAVSSPSEWETANGGEVPKNPFHVLSDSAHTVDEEIYGDSLTLLKNLNARIGNLLGDSGLDIDTSTISQASEQRQQAANLNFDTPSAHMLVDPRTSMLDSSDDFIGHMDFLHDFEPEVEGLAASRYDGDFGGRSDDCLESAVRTEDMNKEESSNQPIPVGPVRTRARSISQLHNISESKFGLLRSRKSFPVSSSEHETLQRVNGYLVALGNMAYLMEEESELRKALEHQHTEGLSALLGARVEVDKGVIKIHELDTNGNSTMWSRVVAYWESSLEIKVVGRTASSSQRTMAEDHHRPRWWKAISETEHRSLAHGYWILGEQGQRVGWALFDDVQASFVFHALKISDNKKKVKIESSAFDSQNVLLCAPCWTASGTKLWRRVSVGEIFEPISYDGMESKIFGLV